MSFANSISGSFHAFFFRMLFQICDTVLWLMRCSLCKEVKMRWEQIVIKKRIISNSVFVNGYTSQTHKERRLSSDQINSFEATQTCCSDTQNGPHNIVNMCIIWLTLSKTATATITFTMWITTAFSVSFLAFTILCAEVRACNKFISTEQYQRFNRQLDKISHSQFISIFPSAPIYAH